MLLTRGPGRCCTAASAGTYALQAVLAPRHLHAAGADAVAEPLQMLLYLADFPGKKNDGKVNDQQQCGSLDFCVYVLVLFLYCFLQMFLDLSEKS